VWGKNFHGKMTNSTFETDPWLKVEVEARFLAGTGPTAGRLELTAGNERDEAQFSPARRRNKTCLNPEPGKWRNYG